MASAVSTVRGPGSDGSVVTCMHVPVYLRPPLAASPSQLVQVLPPLSNFTRLASFSSVGHHFQGSYHHVSALLSRDAPPPGVVFITLASLLCSRPILA